MSREEEQSKRVLLDLEEQHKEAVKERLKAAEEYNKLLGLSYDKVAAQLQANQELVAKYEERAQLLSMEEEALNAQFDQVEKTIQKHKEAVATGEKANQLSEERLASLQNQSDEIVQIALMSEEMLETEKQRLTEEIRSARNAERRLALTEELGTRLSGNLNSMLGIADASGDIATKMGQLKASGGAWTAVIGNAAKKFFSLENRINMASAAAEKMSDSLVFLAMRGISLGFTLDKAQVGFRTATGAGMEYDAMIKNTYENTSEFSATIEEAAESMQALYSGFTGFNQLSQTAKEDLAAFNVQMTRLGVSAQEQTELFQGMKTVFNATTDETKAFTAELFEVGQQIGVTTGKMVSDFNKNSETISKFGKNATKIFMKSAKVARGLGMEISELLKITDQFDTFEGAAQHVGELNAILGGPFLNSMEMIEKTDPVERVRALAGAIEQSGQSWNDMGYYAKKAVAQAAGMSVEAAGKVFREGTAGINAWASEMKEADADQKAMEEQAKLNNTVMMEWSRILNDLSAFFMPLVGYARDFVGILRDMGLTSKPVVIGLGAMWAIFKGMQIAISATAAAKALYAKATGASTVAEGANAASKSVLSGATAFLGATSTAAAAPIMALAAAILSAGFAILMVLGGFALMAVAFKGLGTDGITLAVVLGMLFAAVAFGSPALMAFGTAALAAAPGFYALAPPLFMIGVAIALVAAGFGLLAFGIAAIIDSITGLVTLMIQNHEVVLMVAGSLAIMALSAMGLAFAGIFAAGALVAIALGLGAIAVALAFISTDDLQAMGDIFQGMGNIGSETITTIYGMVDAIKAMAEAAEDIEFNEDKFSALRNTVDALAQTKGMNAKVLAQTTHTIKAMADLTRSSAEARVEPMQMALNIVKEIKGGPTTAAAAPAAAAATGGNTIVLQLNERELARAVNAALNGKYNEAKLS